MLLVSFEEHAFEVVSRLMVRAFGCWHVVSQGLCCVVASMHCTQPCCSHHARFGMPPSKLGLAVHNMGRIS